MVLFNCELCSKIFKNPIECLKCHNTFCEDHLNNKNQCPLCKTISNYYTNSWLLKALEDYKKEENRKKELLKKCVLCHFEGEEDSFFVHLIEDHKSEIITFFTFKEENNIQTITLDNDIDLDYYKFSSLDYNKKATFSENDDIEETYLSNNNKNNFTNNCEQLGDSQRRNNTPKINLNKDSIIYKGENNRHKRIRTKNNGIKNLSIDKKRNIKIYNPKMLQIIFEKYTLKTKRDNIFYCGRQNEIIKCDCCQDHICRKGNCLCVSCMRNNISNLKLKNGELINKSGIIATYQLGKYYCGKKTKTILINYIGQEFITNHICNSIFPCKDCKTLKKFMIYYLEKTVYNRIKNS